MRSHTCYIAESVCLLGTQGHFFDAAHRAKSKLSLLSKPPSLSKGLSSNFLQIRLVTSIEVSRLTGWGGCLSSRNRTLSSAHILKKVFGASRCQETDLCRILLLLHIYIYIYYYYIYSLLYRGALIYLKSTKTQYGNVCFRSKLESEWARHFDACAVPWKYEPQRFFFDSGLSYLPDFSLAGCLWLEIKPTLPTEHEERLCQLLAAHLSSSVYIACGPPWKFLLATVTADGATISDGSPGRTGLQATKSGSERLWKTNLSPALARLRERGWRTRNP